MADVINFAAGIPECVQKKILFLLEGDGGWLSSLDSAEYELSELDASIQNCIRHGKEDYLPGLRHRRLEALRHRDGLKKSVSCLLRFGQDPRMADAFRILIDHKVSDEVMNKFTYAAWIASGDFSEFRSKHKESEDIAQQIAGAAENLAKLLRRFSNTGVTAPSEFFSVPALLEGTDNERLNGYNLEMWRGMRSYILGRDRDEIRVVTEGPEGSDVFETLPKVVVKIVSMADKQPLSADEERKNTLRYAWNTAPDVPAILDTLARSAREFKPSSGGLFDVVIATRQSNAKTEFIRGFGEALTEIYGIEMTTQIKKAMAIVGSVAINDPEIDVTYDDVRKALSRLEK
jgi:hypothetical protein